MMTVSPELEALVAQTAIFLVQIDDHTDCSTQASSANIVQFFANSTVTFFQMMRLFSAVFSVTSACGALITDREAIHWTSTELPFEMMRPFITLPQTIVFPVRETTLP